MHNTPRAMVSNHRGTRSGLSDIAPRRIGELPVEGATDRVDEPGVGGASLSPASFCERQEAFDPASAVVTVGSLGALTPHNSNAPRAFRPVLGGFHAVCQQQDPQRIPRAAQGADQRSRLVLALLVAMEEVAQPGRPCPPLPPGRRGRGQVTQTLARRHCPLAAGGALWVGAQGAATRPPEERRQTGVALGDPGVIDARALTDHNADPVGNESRACRFGTARVDALAGPLWRRQAPAPREGPLAQPRCCSPVPHRGWRTRRAMAA